MNNILSLRGTFNTRKKAVNPPIAKLNKSVSSEEILEIINQLEMVLLYFENQKYLDGILASVNYVEIIPKTRRIREMFKQGSSDINDAVVGAKYVDEKHVITYYISKNRVKNTINDLINIEKAITNVFDGIISDEEMNNQELLNKVINNDNYNIKKTKFKNYLADISNVEKITVEEAELKENRQHIVSFYDTQLNLLEFLRAVGITKITKNRIIKNNTALLYYDEYQLLLNNAPYMVSMSTVDFNELSSEDIFSDEIDLTENIETKLIGSPGNEPTIGVIDTLFDERVYFSEWVEFHNEIAEDIPISPADYKHGTSVTSIIVDGPRLNPEYEDNCGYFKVRHFGVAVSKGFSSFHIIKKIEDIIVKNQDVKVWNLSLGSNEAINDNFISAEGSEIDRIQYENDVIFVIAGTNKQPSDPDRKIGAPADSINSLVVNSVNFLGNIPEYAREGMVLKYFNKPDVSYYGGCNLEFMNVCENDLGVDKKCGTSFAAPWISRKLSFLIDKLDMPREVAKALIIDSAINWNIDASDDKVKKIGFGIVPKDINDIVKSTEEQIKFYVTGVSSKDETFNSNFPIPLNEDGKYPYKVKVLLCYFPNSSRAQGVDYTNTELNIKFGRMNKNGKLVSINSDVQGIPNEYTKELSAKNLYRKWDNIKFLTATTPGKSNRPVTVLDPNIENWTMQISSLGRSLNSEREIKFGVIVTLEALDGVDRYQSFIRDCELNGWLVNEIDLKQRIEISAIVEEEIIFD